MKEILKEFISDFKKSPNWQKPYLLAAIIFFFPFLLFVALIAHDPIAEKQHKEYVDFLVNDMGGRESLENLAKKESNEKS